MPEQNFKDYITAGNKVNGKLPKLRGTFKLQFSGSTSEITFGNNCSLVNINLDLRGGNNSLIIGDNSKINGSVNIGNSSFVCVGSNVNMNRKCYLVAQEGANITIGDGCLLSDVRIMTTDWHSILDLKTGERINPARDVVIENDVWIGERVSVYKGAWIQSGSVIGGGSIVSKNIPSNCLAVGAPAIPIRYNIEWKRELIPLPSLPVRT